MNHQEEFKGVSQKLAEFCERLTYDQLTDDLIDIVKYRMIDFLGVTARGSEADSSQSMYRFVREMNSNGGTGVIVGIKEKGPCVYAALANGVSAHAVEMDDVNNEPSLHPSAVIFPAALAAAEMVQATGKALIESVVVGYDVMVRIGTALRPDPAYRRGFHPTGVCGVFGAAAAASKLLGLGQERTLSALGIAGSQAAGSMEYLAQGAWTKRFHPGWAAHSGILAALISRSGFWGPTTIIEGRDGFLHAYSESADVTKVLPGLGAEFKILQTSVKPFPCCRFMHPPIDAILRLVKQHKISPNEVARVKLGILTGGALLIAEPEELKYNPKSVVDAQFSMPYGAAVALLYGKVGLDEFQESMIASPEVNAMMKRIEYFKDPELDKTFPRQWCGTAEIIMKDGTRYFTKVEYPKGDPENPLSWEEMIERFHDMAGLTMSEDRRARVVNEVKQLETIRNVREWAPLFQGDV